VFTVGHAHARLTLFADAAFRHERPVLRHAAACSQAALHPRWAWDVGLHGRRTKSGQYLPLYRENPTALAGYIGWLRRQLSNPSHSWKDLQWIRGLLGRDR